MSVTPSTSRLRGLLAPSGPTGGGSTATTRRPTPISASTNSSATPDLYSRSIRPRRKVSARRPNLPARADAYARTQLLRRDDWLALAGDGSEPIDVGASALWLAGLSYSATPDIETIRGLARFLTLNVFPNGAVAEAYDRTSGAIPDRFSPFFTGEVWWALTRAHVVLPGEGWNEVADRISRYVATERDETERWFPPLPDHWASYALAETAALRPLHDYEARYARRVAELESLQIRYESQRTNSTFSKLVRGHQALPAGLGTMSEALNALWRVSTRDEALAEARSVLAERAGCAAGQLVQRQIDDVEALAYPQPRYTQGAWLHEGVTQIDDQQHAMSALLAYLEILDD